MKKDFINGTEFSLEELQNIIKLAIALKNGEKLPDLSNKILTLIFANPSLRTRLSFESGMKKLGGNVNVLSTTDSWEFEYDENAIMNGSTQEHIKEASPVISSYSDCIALRKCDLMTKKAKTKLSKSWSELRKDTAIHKLAQFSDKPIINMESNMFHPCQGMADVMTIYEHFKTLQEKKYVLTWAPHPKPLPLATPHSQLLTPALFGMHITLAHPEGFDLDSDVVKLAEEKTNALGGSLSITNNQMDAFEDADVIVAKSWASLDCFENGKEESMYRSKFSDWIVNKEKMEITNDAVFLHCLPVRRNVVVTDEVIEGNNSLVISEAENRMWVQMAILSALLSPKS